MLNDICYRSNEFDYADRTLNQLTYLIHMCRNDSVDKYQKQWMIVFAYQTFDVTINYSLYRPRYNIIHECFYNIYIKFRELVNKIPQKLRESDSEFNNFINDEIAKLIKCICEMRSLLMKEWSSQHIWEGAIYIYNFNKKYQKAISKIDRRNRIKLTPEMADKLSGECEITLYNDKVIIESRNKGDE